MPIFFIAQATQCLKSCAYFCAYLLKDERRSILVALCQKITYFMAIFLVSYELFDYTLKLLMSSVLIVFVFPFYSIVDTQHEARNQKEDDGWQGKQKKESPVAHCQSSQSETSFYMWSILISCYTRPNLTSDTRRILISYIRPIAVTLGCSEFNFGSAASHQFMRSLNWTVGNETQKRGRKRDHRQLIKAATAVTLKARRYRIKKAEAQEKSIAALRSSDAGNGD